MALGEDALSAAENDLRQFLRTGFEIGEGQLAIQPEYADNFDDEPTASESFVAVPWTLEASGRRRGQLEGYSTQDRSVNIRGVTFFDVRNGVVQSESASRTIDFANLLAQLGVIPHGRQERASNSDEIG